MGTLRQGTILNHSSVSRNNKLFQLGNDLRANKYIFLLFLVLMSVSVQAGPAEMQQKLDLSIPSVRSSYVAKLAEKSQAAKAKAEAWAQARGIPLRYDDGWMVSELMYLQDGRPVYYVTHNVNAAISIATDLIRNTAPYNLNGSGMTVGIWDEGAVRSTHQEFGGRVTIYDAVDNSNHSTHVAGTVGAGGVVSSALGMAPAVGIDSYDWNNDTSEMAGRGASYAGEPGKIYVSNHSYGIWLGWMQCGYECYLWNPAVAWDGAGTIETQFGQYNSAARTYDDIVYNAPYYLIFKSAGNDRNDNPSAGSTVYYTTDGGENWSTITYDLSTCPPGDGNYKSGYDTIGPRGSAKNLMTVGALNDAVQSGSRHLPNATMSSFSGWGPTDDGRIKPDIVANGVNLYSPIADSNTAYDSHSGTSMSAPSAAGSAILLAEYYGELFPGQAMRSSTLKGLIIHTADDLGNPGPDYSYGWGLMNTKAATALIKDHNDFPSENMIVEAVVDGGNPNDIYAVNWDGTGEFRVTLCWTDPPGTASSSLDDPSSKLVNDLDLRITGPGGSPTYYPYILEPTNPSVAATTGDNTLDNVEQVHIPATGVAGTYTVEVSHKGTLTNGTQDYSLIMVADEYECCPTIISSYPYTEGFESGFGDWVNVEGDDIDWTRHTGSTTSSGTGPPSAHEGAYYLYTESSTSGVGYPNKTAILEGPCLDLGSVSNPELRFWYHMYGTNMGTLTVELSDDNCASWITVWILSGNQGDVWYEAIVDLSAYAGSTIKIKFNGLTGSSYTSDMAIDDVHIEDVAPQPPVAEDVNVPTSLNTPVTITLEASDDGYPDPPGILTYIVTSLPSDGTLSDPSAGGISSVPYTLVNNGNQVVYTPDSGYTGLDSFQFKANDGGVPPDGGDSNTATVSINVTNYISLFFDDFPITTLNPNNWPNTLGTPTVDGLAGNEPSPPYSLHLEYNEEVQSRVLDLFNVLSVRMKYYWMRYSTESGDDLYVDYWDGSSWQRLRTHLYNEGSTTVFTEEIVNLPAEALHPGFRLRFQASCSSSVDEWYIDDVELTGVSAGPRPPVAADDNVVTRVDTPVLLTLAAIDGGLPAPPGALTYIITSLPAHGDLNDPGASAIGSVPYTLVNNGNQVVYTPDSGYTGLDSFQFKANDGGVPPDGGDSNTATVSLEVSDSTTVEYQVGSSYDDAYAYRSTSNTMMATYLKVGYSSSYYVPYYMSGVRFTNVNVPKGATIISAYLKIQSYTSNLTSSVYGKIQAEATDDADDFNGRYIGSLAKTSASVDWDHSTSWSTNTWYTSPNIAGVVQEVINQSGWSANNSLAIFYSTRTASGGYRWFSSYDRGSSYAPKLEITYTDPVTLRYTISGRVTYQGSGLADVNMVGLGVVTDANGYYSGMVSYGWSGTVTPTKEGYSFDPADRTYSNVTANQTGENYTGTPGWNISEHVFSIEIETGWDHGEPTNSDDLTYDFYLGLETDETVNLVEVNTAAGNTFTIPNDVNTQSGDIQTWHYVDHNTHYWEYEGKFADQNALADYGDGNYTITVYYESGGQDQTTVLFGDPNTGDPITQPIQEPNLTFPEHNGTVTSPVTFTWQDCNDSNATSIWLGLEKQDANEVIDINFPADINSSEPVTLNKGMWEAELCFDKWYDFNNADGIPVEIGKYSESNYTFKVISLPSDDFNDNGRAAMWEIYNSGGPENCWLAESNQRLEVRSTTDANSEDTGYVSYKWKVDAISDFSFKVNFYYNPATSGEGDGRVFIHLSPSLTDVYSIHVDFSAGRDVYSPYFYCEVVDPCLGPTDIHRIDRTEDDGTLYVSYNATNDELYLSYTGYGSPNAWQAIPGLLQAQWGGAPVYVNIGGGSEGVKLDSGDAYLDNFVIESGVIEVDDAPVYRFWSPTKERHFYTISERERDKLIDKYPHVWTYEGIVYYDFSVDTEPGLKPVYRFWSPVLEAHFYTISESERDKLINIYPHVWTYEGTAMCAYPEGQQPENAEEVYRFWSPVLETHFYTISEEERDKLIDNYPHIWTYEGIAWYAYE